MHTEYMASRYAPDTKSPLALRDTAAQLETEVAERKRAEAATHVAEAATHVLMATLDWRLAARTEQLATFFDLSVLAGRATNLGDVFAQVLPHIIEVTCSRAICLHLLDADRTNLQLAAQLNLSPDLDLTVPLWGAPLAFQRWMSQPGDPLLTTALPLWQPAPEALRSK